MDNKEIVNRIISIAQNVHKEIGPGLDDAVYKKCMHIDFMKMNMPVEIDKPLVIQYDSVELPTDYQMDFVLGQQAVVQVKSVDALCDEDHQEIFSFVKCGNYPLGLLINFNVVSLKSGIVKVFNR